MCGILFAVGEALMDDFELALSRLKSRGPDARETIRHGEAMLGHSRLAVIDIAGGRQPIQSPDGRFAMVYNGEIYNFADLRSQLRSAGYAFSTLSDTEVLFAGYLHWGERVLEMLDGMFAFVVHDRSTGEVFCARDRLGIKPLFWGECRGGTGLVIASTVEPFFAFSAFPKRLDAEGLRDYLAFQTPLAPRTLVRDVHALAPGASLRWRVGKGGIGRQWWQIPAASLPPPDRDELVDETDGLVTKAVKDQLVADVPLGAFLSGGIDSSLIVHYMAKAGCGPLKTFSVRFPDARFDESRHAAAVAERFGTEHHVLDAPLLDADTLVAAIQDLDQPLADPAYLPTWALSRLTREHVTVALSGDGGDEIFGGYPRFLDTADRYPDTYAKTLIRTLIRLRVAPAALTRRALAGRELLRYRRVELGDYPGTRKDLHQFLIPELAAASRPFATLERWRELVERFGSYDRGALLRADLWTYLSENCLAKTDRASMAHGLEIRVPLLATPVLVRMLELPAEVHFDSGGGKSILRALARRHLPETVWNRPKHGFSVPLRENFAGPWHDWLEARMAKARIVAPWLRDAALARLFAAGIRGKGNVRLVYTFAVLLAWLESHPLDY